MKGKKMSKRVKMAGFVLLLVVVLITSMGLAEEAKSGIKVEPYVRIKLDASIDSSRTSPGNYVTSVTNQTGATTKSDDEFNMTARETRLGVNVSGVAVDSVDISGRIEIDFYGEGYSPAATTYVQPDNKALLMLRHAYAQVDWKEKNISLLAGQTSDVISPLTPRTLNYSVLWMNGNIGYRRAQIRGTWDKPIKEDTTLTIQTALVRSIGETMLLGSGATGVESGPDAGLPTLQVRVALTRPLGGPSPATIGVSGHWGREEYDWVGSGSRERVDTWSVNCDALLPVTKWLVLKGEFFTGANLDTYLGGGGQGVAEVGTAPLKEINSSGGWVAAEMGPWKDWSFTAGIGMDDVDDDDLTGAGDIERSQCVFGNAIYALNKYVSMGVEVSKWRTDYMVNGNSNATRAQFSMILKN
jgi:hypothetical protein